MTMAMPHIVCNHCEDVILDVHSCTIYRGTLYHWLCLKKMREDAHRRSEELTLPESIDGRDGTRGGVGRFSGCKSSMKRAFNWLFRRKT